MMACGQLPVGGCGNPDLGHKGPCTPKEFDPTKHVVENVLSLKACEIHDMLWCAICNGDAKKFEESQEQEERYPLFLGLQGKSK
jgi:hypothetical protein